LAISAALVRDYPDLSAAYVIHGDLMRRADQCGGAIAAYSRAIDMRDATQRSTAPLLFLRAVCHDHVGDWAAAETDLRAALDLIPDDPRFLNFLGYGLVEQRRNLDEALGMIERAVEQRPTSGAIVDSLAWVLYRLGRFDDAVDPMERAVTLEPTDPIINDHLGDVYWMVGRRNEARFQWQRALSFDPTPEDAARIRLKLELGLDAVLRSEGGVGAVE
jgi:Flp pilus assembly protein TadD